MSVTISVRSLYGFAAGIIVAAVGMFMFQALRADAGSADESTFVAMTSCRLADTRPAPDRVGPNSTWGPEQTKTLQATGTNGKCTIPPEASGLLLKVFALNATGEGFVTVWADGALPLGSALNPSPAGIVFSAVTTELSPTGSFKLFNKTGRTDVIIDVNGYYTKESLQEIGTRLTAVESRLAALESKTASMSTLTVDGQPTVRFTDVNVQIVDGSGDTIGAVNGRGNLIVGYNEGTAATRTGSHNLIVGTEHSYTSYGGFIAGFANTVSGPFASVSGGFGNSASGLWSSVSGGVENTASGDWASVSGGEDNSASGPASSVSGGNVNTASSTWSSVSGGDGNTAGGFWSSVSGGAGNTAGGDWSSVSGGNENVAEGRYSSASGGGFNLASGSYSSVSGGDANVASGSKSSVSGGTVSQALGVGDSVVGGDSVACDGIISVVVCGEGVLTPVD